jgi:hypothetical protein
MQDKQAKARASAAASVNARKAKAQPTYNECLTTAERTLSDRSTDVELPTPTPTPTPTPITKREKTGASAEIVFPEGLDRNAWDAWLQYRKTTGKALRPISLNAAMQALAKHGPNQIAVVEQSIANGWQGLFAIKTGNGFGQVNKQAAVEQRNQAAVDEWLAQQGDIDESK